jgi:hypothetical protein
MAGASLAKRTLAGHGNKDMLRISAPKPWQVQTRESEPFLGRGLEAKFDGESCYKSPGLCQRGFGDLQHGASVSALCATAAPSRVLSRAYQRATGSVCAATSQRTCA